MNAGQRDRLWLPALGLSLGLLAAWIGVLQADRVPILSLVDLGFHELGHLLATPFSDLTTARAGSVLQVAVPVALAVYFLVAQGDWAGTGLCLVWAGTSARNVAVYIADAPYQSLPLIGGEHDWAYILGSTGRLDRAADLAGNVTVLAVVLATVGIGASVWALAKAWLSTVPETSVPIAPGP